MVQDKECKAANPTLFNGVKLRQSSIIKALVGLTAIACQLFTSLGGVTNRTVYLKALGREQVPLILEPLIPTDWK